jgi:acetyltransferase
MKAILNRFFNPQSIAVIGATLKQEKIGFAVMQNLRLFDGRVYPVNPKYRALGDNKCYEGIRDLPESVDLAVITTPLNRIPGIISSLGTSGVLCALILTGSTALSGAARRQYELELLDVAKRAGIRIIGPGSLGIQSPVLGLNATFGVAMPPPGRIAFITQSGTIGAAILDWAADKKVGFSRFVSLGGMVDIAFDDLIDYLGTDSQTNCILLYVERVTNARRFMSAARAFARAKPMVVLKAGVTAEGARAIMLHNGGAAGDDTVYDAAFQRAGVIRVHSIQALFDCAQALASQPLPKSNRLAIVTNAGGPAILASDELSERGGVLTSLQYGPSGKTPPETDEEYRNPVHIGGDGRVDAFRQAVSTCLADPGADGLLAIVTPQYMTDPEAMAQVLAEKAKGCGKPVLASWMGQKGVLGGRSVLEAFSIPWYPFPERAVTAFMHMARYREMLDLLRVAPSDAPIEYKGAGYRQTRGIIKRALSEGRPQLRPEEALAFLSAYGMTVERHEVLYETEQIVDRAVKIGFPVEMTQTDAATLPEGSERVIRIVVESEEGLRRAYQYMRAQYDHGGADAVRVDVMIKKAPMSAPSLYIHAQKDEVFGPVIFLGTGPFTMSDAKRGVAALPPLNMALAGHLIREVCQKASFSGNSILLKEGGQALQELLCRFAHLLVCEPQVRSVDAGPLVLHAEDVVVVGAQVLLDITWKGSEDPHKHLCILPYPEHWIKQVTLKDGTELVFRPIRPEDGPLEAALINNTSKESLYFRFFGFVPGLDQRQLARFTHIDYDREMAIVAVRIQDGKEEMLGVVRIVGDAWRKDAEYAILVSDAWHGKGLGSLLTDYIIDIARVQGYERVKAFFLKQNTAMRRLFERKQFTIRNGTDDADEAEWVF